MVGMLPTVGRNVSALTGFQECSGLRRLTIKTAIDQPANLEQAGPDRGRHNGRSVRKEQSFVSEDDGLVQRTAQYIGSDRAIAANQPLLPGFRRFGTDEPSLRYAQWFRGC